MIVVLTSLATVVWVVVAMDGLSKKKHRVFYARMALLTPIWPLALCVWLPRRIVEGVLWLIEQARLGR